MQSESSGHPEAERRQMAVRGSKQQYSFSSPALAGPASVDWSRVHHPRPLALAYNQRFCDSRRGDVIGAVQGRDALSIPVVLGIFPNFLCDAGAGFGRRARDDSDIRTMALVF